MTDPFSLAQVLQSESIEADSGVFFCRVEETFVGFDGHFPGTPVVPGVCQLHWVYEAVSRVCGLSPLPVRELARVKFHELLTPGTDFTLRVWRVEGGFLYELSSGMVRFASGKLVLSCSGFA